MASDTVVIRVSRWLLLLLMAIGALFGLAGFDLLYFHAVLEISNPLLAWLFGGFGVAVAALLLVTQGWYLLLPPVMMRITREEVSFGTGLRYHQTFIPLRYLRSVGVFRKQSDLEVLGKRNVVDGGIELQFERNAELPAGMATSAGVMYSDYCLRLDKRYMNCSPTRVVEKVQQVWRGRA